METKVPSSSSRSSFRVFLSSTSTGPHFIDHLSTALSNAGFRALGDKDDIQIGHLIKPQLQRAIQHSTISIIVFTRHYAFSKWCLDELLLILERKRFDDHYVVIPIFYDVQPREVGNQTGSFAKAFHEYEESGEHSKEKTDQWRKALKDVSKLAGQVLQDECNGREAAFIQTFVNKLGTMLEQTGLDVTSYTVGIGSRVRDIDLWLKDPEDGVLGVISGKRGIGKTTIAKVAYHKNSADFEACSFLANLREALAEEDGLLRLQTQLLSDVSSKGKVKQKINNIKEGFDLIQEAISGKRVLFILDDLVEIQRFDALLGPAHAFPKGCKIIITTSCVQLPSHLIHKTFRIKQLDDHDSLRLFSLHAFSKFHPTQDYLERSERVVQHCEGVPLALQVMGSSLSGKNSDCWRSALQKLEAVPDEQVHKALEVGYDLLHEDGHQHQQLFRAIASCCVGKDKDDAVQMLKQHDFYSKEGMQNLIDRSLISIDDQEKKLLMHTSVRDMARAIKSPETVGSPGKLNICSSTGAPTATVTSEGSPSCKSDKYGKRKRSSEDEEAESDVQGSNLFKRFVSLFRYRK